MLETLSSIFFYSTLIVVLLSTITLCAFTALIFTKVEVSAALEEKCDTCQSSSFIYEMYQRISDYNIRCKFRIQCL